MTTFTQKRIDTLIQIFNERSFQNEKFREGSDIWDDSDLTKLSVLTEEVGEVAKAINDGDLQNLREELVQVAAVAIAWLETFDDPRKTE